MNMHFCMRSLALYLVIVALSYAYPTAASHSGSKCVPQTIVCADGDGASPNYLKCVQGRFVQESCPQGSVCVGSKDTTVFCAADDSHTSPSSSASSSSSSSAPSSSSVSSSTSAPSSSSTSSSTSSSSSAASPPSNSILSSILSSLSSPDTPLPPVAPKPQLPVAQMRPPVVSSSPPFPAQPQPSPGFLSRNAIPQQGLPLQQSVRSAALPPQQQQRQQQQPVGAAIGLAFAAQNGNPPVPVNDQVRSSPVDLSQSTGPIWLFGEPRESAALQQQPPMALQPPPILQNAPTGVLPPISILTLAPPMPFVPLPVSSSPTSPWQIMNAGSNPVDAAPEAPRPQQPLQAPPMIQVQQPTTRTAVGWPSAIARFSDDLDGMDAKQVVSIIGSLIISQHKYTALPTFATPSSAPSAASNPLATDAPDRQMQTLVPQQTAGATPRVPPPIVPQAAVELVRDDSDHGGEGVVPYIPYRAPGTCSPGEFVCEAHGLRPGFFACDASGFALPAACAVNEVCYQYGRSILCDAPGRGAAAASASRGVSY